GLRQLKLGAELEIQSLVMKINKSKSMIDTLKLNLELANKVYEMCEEAYKLGSKEYLEVKEQEDQKNSAKITLLQEQYNYLTAILDLQYATNSNLKDEVKK
ncbi:MAG TPA: TolC family protein, partial [Spirochaetota bacterium]|nr:TolC family protein [Spirochaetota bacterium]